MQISKELKVFLRDNAELIKQNNFDELYDSAYTDIEDIDLISDLTNFLYSLDIDPVKYFKDTIPEYFSNRFKPLNTTSVFEITDNIEYIDDFAFINNYIRNIKLSNNLKIIGAEAFHNSFYLKELILPESVEEIYPYAFVGCHLNLIEIKNPNIQIDDFAFSELSTGTIIKYHGTKKQWDTNLDSDQFENCIIECIDGTIEPD